MREYLNIHGSSSLRCSTSSSRRQFLRHVFPSAAVLVVLVSLTSLVVDYKNSGGNNDNNLIVVVGKKIRKKNDDGDGINSDVGPFEATWLNKTIYSISKPWTPKTNKNWCVVDSRSSDGGSGGGSSSMRTTEIEKEGEREDYDETKGLWFVKNYKAASSTGAGITARIAHTAAFVVAVDEDGGEEGSDTQQQSNAATPHCMYYASHDFADSGRHKRLDRDKEHSFMWSIVRHPVERVLSGYSYFRAAPGRTNEGQTPNVDEEIIMYASSERSAQVKLLDTMTNSWTTPSSTMSSRPDKKSKDSSLPWEGIISPSRAATIIQESIMTSYDFIGVQDRMEESLAVLKLLLDLNGSWDVVVLPSKRVRGGSSSYTRGPAGKCVKQFPLETNYTLKSSTRQFLDNDFLDVRYNYDVLLYVAANHALDRTIEHIGRTVVQDELNRQQTMRKLAYDVCLPTAKFPCSTEGKLQLGLAKDSCYNEDWGCGFHCVDELKRSHGDLNK